MDRILPSLQAEAVKLLDALTPLVKAAYFRGFVDGAVAAAIVFLLLHALTHRGTSA